MKTIKLGILVDSGEIPAWAWEMLRVIEAEGFANTVLVIRNQTPKASGTASSLFYRTYRWIDRKLFSVRHDAFARKNIFTVPGLTVAELTVKPIQKKFSDWIESEDILRIKSYEVDVLIRLGFRILKGDILSVAPFGIWSYHHGDNHKNRGGPPCFWEVMLGWWVSGSVLQVLSEKLDGGTVLYRSWSRTDPLSVNRNANKVYWKSLHFIPRQLKELATQGEQAWRHRLATCQDEQREYTNPLFSPPENGRMLLLLFPFLWRNMRRKFRELIRREFWQIYVGQWNGQWPILPKQAVAITAANGRYYADPVICTQGEEQVIFFEDYEYGTRRAAISAGIWRSGKLIEVRPVIQQPFHVSYPFLFVANGKQYMTAEMAAAGKLILYECVQWPFDWKQSGILMQDVQGYDPTVIFKDGKYWLFMNQKAHPEASAFDELFLYWTDDILAPRWNSHPQNPIVSDVRSARPAGRVFFQEGKWFRPAQDSGKMYGHRIKIQEILKWSDSEYEESTHYIIEPDWDLTIQGVHTFNFHGTTFVLDAFSR